MTNYSPTDAYQLALPKMGHDLANKYADYFTKKQLAIKIEMVLVVLIAPIEKFGKDLMI